MLVFLFRENLLNEMTKSWNISTFEGHAEKEINKCIKKCRRENSRDISWKFRKGLVKKKKKKEALYKSVMYHRTGRTLSVMSDTNLTKTIWKNKYLDKLSYFLTLKGSPAWWLTGPVVMGSRVLRHYQEFLSLSPPPPCLLPSVGPSSSFIPAGIFAGVEDGAWLSFPQQL